MKNVLKKFLGCTLVLIIIGLLIGYSQFDCDAKGNKSIAVEKTSESSNKVAKKSTKKSTIKKETEKKGAQLTATALEAGKTITIKCVGDSVTEGMSMPDAYNAKIGGSTYPSILYTMLNANGIDAVVENAGHGGETTASIIARLGGVPLYVNEDLVFDANGCAGPIDNKFTAVYGNDLHIPVTFTYTYTDVNPIIIGGKQYTAKPQMVGNNKWMTYLYKASNDNTTSIKAGENIQISGSRNNSIDIIFAGINDGEEITIDEYVTMLKNGAAVNGNNCLIVGPHSPIYDKKNFVSGSTSVERRKNYRNRMYEEFGERFIDLNTEWCERALSVALTKGYFSDLTNTQIAAIQSKLDKRIIPAEFTYNNTDYNVHLNEAGYTGVAQIIYEHLVKLGYF